MLPRLLLASCCWLLLGCTSSSAPVVGGPCASDADCGELRCVTFSGEARCTNECQDDDACEDGQSCALVPLTGSLLTVCLPQGERRPGGGVCVGDADCASNLCQELLCASLCGACPSGECVAATVARDDLEAQVGTCRWRHDWQQLDLGAVTTPGGSSDELTVDVPAGTLSFTLRLVASDLRLGVASLRSPGGTLLIDGEVDTPDLNPGSSYLGAIAVMVPGSDDHRAAPVAGRWAFTAATFAPEIGEPATPVAGTVDEIAVLFEPVGEEEGSLDLQLHLAPGTGQTAADASESAYVTALLSRLGSYLDLAGIGLGEVGYSDLSEDDNVVADGDQARHLCRTKAVPGRHGTAVNVFLVQELGFTAGFSGGVPGPPGVFDQPSSGIVAQAQETGARTGTLLAHEVMHFLGLWHTTEQGAARWDPISDTPECAAGTSVSECPDAGNLMFPVFPLTDNLILTPGQVSVARRSPLLYEVTRPTACPVTPVTIDVTEALFASGRTDLLVDSLAGTCGGAGAPERTHLYRLTEEGLAALRLTVTGRDFDPVVYVRRGDCLAVEDLECAAGTAGSPLEIELAAPQRGAYFIVVDGMDAGGLFTLAVDEVQ